MRAYRPLHEWDEREHGMKELELVLLYSLIIRCVQFMRMNETGYQYSCILCSRMVSCLSCLSVL